MHRYLWRIMLVGVLGTLFTGCDRAPMNKHLRDPLLTSKKPIEGKPEQAAPPMVAREEPAPPTVPETALASAPVKPEALGVQHAGGSSAVAPDVAKPEPSPPPRAPLSATPAVRSGAALEVPADPVSRQQPLGDYGHAPDHSWLQGVLDRHYHGHMDLRYCDHTTEDDWGGKVVLEDDPRLAQFKDGDVVRVEGELVHENGQVKRGYWNHFPHYKIREIRLIHSKP
jgi:hypothetical protein